LLKNDVAIPSPLRRVGESIAGKPVTALRIYSALAIFILSALMAASLLWVSVRSSITAIGRNPLSHHSIFRGMSQAIVIAVLVFIIGMFGVYLLLRI